MTAAGTDIYIAGGEGGIPEYWKNGTVHALPVKKGDGLTGMAIGR